MASYLDNIPTFNEYVEQRPQDDMLKVGLFKQQRYEEGVKKIQDSIDNIAGLDVVRPQDKEYLQSKLNALGGQLQSVAASDFSNFQLVNTVDGMTKQLVNDPLILNAVGSTARYRNQLESQEKINADGKGSASNDMYFNKQVQNWFDGGPDAAFTAQYKPYVDYGKMAQDVVKNLAAEETENDIYAGTDAQGRIVYYDAVTRTKIEALTPERIQQALLTSLPQDAWSQINIDGQYRYANESNEAFASRINSEYTSTFNSMLEEIEEMKVLKNASSSSREKEEIQFQIDAKQREAEALREEYDLVSETFTSGDVDSARGRLYSTDWMRDFTNAYAYRNISQTVHTNPFRQTQLKVQQMQQEQDQFTARYLQTERQNEIENNIEREKLNLLKKDAYGGVATSQVNELSPGEIIAYVEENNKKASNELDTQKLDILTKYKLDENGLNTLMTQFKSNPSSLTSDVQDDLALLEDLMIQKRANDNFLAQIREEALQLYPEDLTNDPENKSFMLNGYEFSYLESEEKMQDFADKYFTYGGSVDAPYKIISEEDRAQAKSELSSKDYELFELFRAGYYDDALYSEWDDAFDKRYGDGSRNSGDEEEALWADLKDFSTYYSRTGAENAKNRQKYVAEELKKSIIVKQPVAYNVPLTNPAQRNQFGGVLLGIAQNLDLLDEDDAAELTKIASDLEVATVTTAGLDGKYYINAVGNKGTKMQIELSEQQYEQIFGDRYKPSADMEMFNTTILPQMLNTRPKLKKIGADFYKDPQSYWSTSLDGEYTTTPENSFLNGRSAFPNTRYYGVSGNLTSTGNPKVTPSQFRLHLQIYDPTSQSIKGVQFPSIIQKENVMFTLSQITDEVIFELLNPGVQMSQAQYQRLAQEAQNPSSGTSAYYKMLEQEQQQ